MRREHQIVGLRSFPSFSINKQLGAKRKRVHQAKAFDYRKRIPRYRQADAEKGTKKQQISGSAQPNDRLWRIRDLAGRAPKIGSQQEGIRRNIPCSRRSAQQTRPPLSGRRSISAQSKVQNRDRPEGRRNILNRNHKINEIIQCRYCDVWYKRGFGRKISKSYLRFEGIHYEPNKKKKRNSSVEQSYYIG